MGTLGLGWWGQPTPALPCWRRVAVLLLSAFALLLAACAQAPLPRGAPGQALPPRADTAFAPIEAQIAAQHGPDVSGFLPLHDSLQALQWRLAVVDAARHSLDLQMYVWYGDQVGQLLMARVLAAATRGVRVRLLVDDLSTLLHDMEQVAVRDAVLREIDRHPHIEIRLFNPWRQRTLAGRALEAGADFQRLNHRMHNKQMVADNQALLIGGRNMGDEYFGMHPRFNFVDLDLLALGPVARQASRVFDRYWNSPQVSPLRRLSAPAAATDPAPAASEADRAALAALQASPRTRALLAGRQPWDAALAALAAQLLPGRAEVLADAPLREEAQPGAASRSAHALVRSARQAVWITNAYVIPNPALLAELQGLQAHGVRVRLLTNSLASHDVPAVNSHYEAWRVPLLQAGVALHELRADAALQRDEVEIAPLDGRAAGRFVGLHTKAIVVDGRYSLVGSMNLDPRSETLNAEMGVIVDSPALAQALAAHAQRSMSGTNSWQVQAGDDGALRWTSDAGTLARQPARSLWQRVQNQVFKLLPPRLY
jgi:putative cardiolipin synthase